MNKRRHWVCLEPIDLGPPPRDPCSVRDWMAVFIAGIHADAREAMVHRDTMQLTARQKFAIGWLAGVDSHMEPDPRHPGDWQWVTEPFTVAWAVDRWHVFTKQEPGRLS